MYREIFLEVLQRTKVGGWCMMATSLGIKWIQSVELAGELVNCLASIVVSSCCKPLLKEAGIWDTGSSGTQGIICHWMLLTEKWWGPWPRTQVSVWVKCKVKCKVKSWLVTKSPINPITNPNPVYSHAINVTIYYFEEIWYLMSITHQQHLHRCYFILNNCEKGWCSLEIKSISNKNWTKSTEHTSSCHTLSPKCQDITLHWSEIITG
jgi:hypothetical protein